MKEESDRFGSNQRIQKLKYSQLPSPAKHARLSLTAFSITYLNYNYLLKSQLLISFNLVR